MEGTALAFVSEEAAWVVVKEGAVAPRRVWTLDYGGSGGDADDDEERASEQPAAKRERALLRVPSLSVFPDGPTGSKQ